MSRTATRRWPPSGRPSGRPPGWLRQQAVPFSSARKWSAASFGRHGTWVLGAPEMVLPGSDREPLAQAARLAAEGRRVLVLARTAGSLDGESLPPGLRPAALIVLAERLRPDAADTIAYFAAQGVALKVISGDSPQTVSAVAAQAGLPRAGDPVDARDLPGDPAQLGRLVEERSVFGRVTPHQKQAMVTALQARGHTVAMTGDGVNDVLALKLADLGIAMGSGAPATKAVAELVLLNGSFGALPGVVAEGRRVTANIERVANLFITKTVWATLLAVAVGVTLLPYPFLPRQLTIIDSLAIGIPSFFLALAPNTRRYQPGFTGRDPALRHPGRRHHRRGHLRRVPAGPGQRPAAGPAAHRGDPGHPHPQPDRADPAGHAADLAPGHPGRRGPGRVRPAVPGRRGTRLLRTRSAARPARGHPADRRGRSPRAGRLLGPVPPDVRRSSRVTHGCGRRSGSAVMHGPACARCRLAA